MIAIDYRLEGPRTVALRRALEAVHDQRSADDLLYLEAWEIEPAPGIARRFA